MKIKTSLSKIQGMGYNNKVGLIMDSLVIKHLRNIPCVHKINVYTRPQWAVYVYMYSQHQQLNGPKINRENGSLNSR